jgi:GDP-4-dehydro-6-deoxy-D-mannose reductase
MIELAESDSRVVIDPERFRAVDIPVASISSERLRRLTGWAPTRSIDAMLADVLAHARSLQNTD